MVFVQARAIAKAMGLLNIDVNARVLVDLKIKVNIMIEAKVDIFVRSKLQVKVIKFPRHWLKSK